MKFELILKEEILERIDGGGASQYTVKKFTSNVTIWQVESKRMRNDIPYKQKSKKVGLGIL